ncbi:unnamed protein product [Lupinus luteus]|uniref:Uncharacterized protein n=1 Tax=Lupinus luteus TaxID=3873 RepID=A0AAV1YAJ0_LUPLU
MVEVAMDAAPLHNHGHLTPYLHLSNKLARRGHKISFFIPKRTQIKLQLLNLHPHLITFFPPHVHGLPHHAETIADVPFSLFTLIATVMDQKKKDIELLLKNLKPQLVFFDFQYWLPILSAAYLGAGSRQSIGKGLSEDDLNESPQGFPDS